MEKPIPTVCIRCNKEFIQCYRKRSNCRSCLDKLKEYRKRKEPKVKVYYVYYLPEENYCGITTDLETRIYRHRNNCNRNTDGYRVLYASENKIEAYSYEAMFHSVLAMEGIYMPGART